MKIFKSIAASLLLISLALLSSGCADKQTAIPLPEHPRPDFQRNDFVNLNGYWSFTFNEPSATATINANTLEGFDQKILVPFPWGSKLSEVEDKGDVAWYGRKIRIPSSWNGKRIFLVIGASDWETTAWVNGEELGTHCGGYTPFEFEITDYVSAGKSGNIFLKVDDTYSDWHLYGKQGYGNARGIWQTAYLEARGSSYIKSLHFSPDIDNEKVHVDLTAAGDVPAGSVVELKFKKGEYKTAKAALDGKTASFDIELPGQHLWDIDDPYLYDVEASLIVAGKTEDVVNSYFGQRKVGTMTVPGKDYKYIALNNKPLYMQICLDQSYTPDGFYTFPSDEFMKNEILLSKNLGLNGNRVHIKVEVPRKLYWADKLGLLIMADVPNFWGQPVPEARQEWENCMRAQVARDYNHPSIFAWVDFNETWGLFSQTPEGRRYMPETQEWVRSMYQLTKSLDPTRLVEDNSACNNDHVQTDINSWHSYQAGYNWEKTAALYDEGTFPGSSFNYIAENRCSDVPMINSECGNVWGYQGSAGDSDFTWDYHEMMNSFHRHPKIGGWLYTEHHDVINEWNGYVQYDRSAKIDGLDEMVPGMSIKDFHSPYYIVPDGELCVDVPAGSEQTVKLYSSFVTSNDPGKLELETVLVGWNSLGEKKTLGSEKCPVEFKPFDLVPVTERKVALPSENGLYELQTILRNGNGDVLHRNFSFFRVKDGSAPDAITFKPASYTAADWSIKNLDVLDGLKVNGFGSGYFEWNVAFPEGFSKDGIKGAKLLFEASAKQVFGKDINDGDKIEGDYMLGKGTVDHCKVSNAYAMTDTDLWPSEVKLSVNGIECGSFKLADDPADHRGVLSWHAQPRAKLMFEGGSYGYLVSADIPAEAFKGESLVIRMTVPQVKEGTAGGGLAIYGADFGRYPLDPTIVISR